MELHPDDSASRITHTLASATPPVGVRIHSSGDFYSAEYVEWWRGIIEALPEVRFWAYSRSWVDSSLLSHLEVLRALPNLQLFASWDDTMSPAPEGWRLSIVRNGPTFSSIGSLDCPEQYDGGPNCANCAYCILANDGNVIFHTH